MSNPSLKKAFIPILITFTAAHTHAAPGKVTPENKPKPSGIVSEADLCALQPTGQECIQSLLKAIATLKQRVQQLETKTADISATTVDGMPSVVFAGVNVYIQNSHAQSSTQSSNGLGNLIIGYNESQAGQNPGRGGSHNLVLGIYNDYQSYGSIVSGIGNIVSKPGASAIGGANNIVNEDSACSIAGYGNTVNGKYAFAGGGFSNLVSAYYAATLAGHSSTASGLYSSVSGGRLNTATNNYSSVSGGYNNTASGQYASVSGGSSNTAAGIYSSIFGSSNLTISGVNTYAP